MIVDKDDVDDDVEFFIYKTFRLYEFGYFIIDLVIALCISQLLFPSNRQYLQLVCKFYRNYFQYYIKS